jgi:dienelactone hydrolase
MHSFLYAIVALLLFLPLCACSSSPGSIGRGNHKPWQMKSPEYPHRPMTWLPDGAAGRQIPCGVIEFDDQGQMWRDANNKTQLVPVLDALEAVTAKGPVQLVLYVHGWNNNANPDEKPGKKNLWKFQESLKAVDRTLAGTGMRAFGVFVSWRGQTLPFTFPPDFYNREASAVKVGRVEATAALQALCTKAKQRKGSRVLAVGHSLGGVILLRTVAQPLTASLVEAVTKAPKGQSVVVPRAMADTVVIVNSADNAILARQMVAVLQDFDVHNRVDGIEVPLLVSVTAKSDFASGAIYTFANRLGRYGFRPFMPHMAGMTVDRHQEKATTTSVGHYKYIHSHALEDERKTAAVHRHGPAPEVTTHRDNAAKKIEALILANTKPRDPRYKDELLIWLDPEMDKAGTRELVAHSLQRKADQNGMANRTPFWIFQCDNYVTKGHHDIWNANFTGLITALQYASESEVPSKTGPRAQQRIDKGKVPKTPPTPQTSARLL